MITKNGKSKRRSLQSYIIVLFLVLSIMFQHGLKISSVTASSPNILISEVYYDTPGDDNVEEWIELFNPTDTTLNITGWTLNDNTYTFTLPNIVMTPMSYLIVARDDTGFYNLFNSHPNVSGMNLALSNSGDVVTLKDENGTIIDQVAYENYLTGWDIYASTGKSIARSSGIDTDSPNDWISDATPSLFAGMEVDNTPPSVKFLYPLNWTNVTGTVNIQINATDSSPIQKYELFINGSLVSNSSTYSWDTTKYNDGPYNLTSSAMDSSGNTGFASIIVFVSNDVYKSEFFKVMTYNVEASGENPDWMEVVKEENADILVCIETGTWDDNNEMIFRDNLTEINNYWESIGEEPYNWSWVDHTSYYPTQGYAIMSRYEIENVFDLNYVTLDNGSVIYFDFVHAKINVAGVTINLIAIHLKAFAGAEYEEKREAQMEGVINYMDNQIPQGEPIILLGDFNSFSPQDTGDLAPKGDLGTGPVSMLIEKGNPHGSVYHNFTDVFRTLNPNDPGYTYGHQDPSHESRIDFIFVNEFFTRNMLVNSTVGDTPHANTGSDHYSVDVFINLVQGIDTVPPAPVLNFKAELVGYINVLLTWDKSPEIDFSHYMLYRNGTFLANLTAETYEDKALLDNTTYVYDIYAVDFSNNVSPKSTVIITTSYLLPPNPPTSLSATVNGKSVTLKWSPPANQNHSEVNYYLVYRSDTSGKGYKLIGNTTDVSFVDDSISEEGTYYYVVTSVNLRGESGYSNEVEVIISGTSGPTNEGNNADEMLLYYGLGGLALVIALMVGIVFWKKRVKKT